MPSVLARLLDDGDASASAAVVVAGEPLVDIWGGFADADRMIAWQRDRQGTGMSGAAGADPLRAMKPCLDLSSQDPGRCRGAGAGQWVVQRAGRAEGLLRPTAPCAYCADSNPARDRRARSAVGRTANPWWDRNNSPTPIVCRRKLRTERASSMHRLRFIL